MCITRHRLPKVALARLQVRDLFARPRELSPVLPRPRRRDVKPGDADHDPGCERPDAEPGTEEEPDRGERHRPEEDLEVRPALPRERRNVLFEPRRPRFVLRDLIVFHPASPSSPLTCRPRRAFAR